MEFNEVLLEGWVAWDGNGISNLPAKNVTLLNGKQGCVLVSEEGASVYEASIEELNNTVEEGEAFVTHSDLTDDTVLNLRTWLDFGDLAETAITYIKYEQYQEAISIGNV